MSSLNPCTNCGQVPAIYGQPEPYSQYVQVICNCGKRGTPSYFFKGCGLDGLNDSQIADIYWNDENPIKKENKE